MNTDTPPTPIEAPDLGDLLIALLPPRQVDVNHWAQDIYDHGALVGLHVHHRDDPDSAWVEERVLFAPVLDLAVTHEGEAERATCPACGVAL